MAEHENTPIFRVTDLTHIYDNTTILDIPKLFFSAGRIYCLYGPNGAGKTTLFEILTLLKKPSQGAVWFKGQEIFPREDGVSALRSQVTLVHQDPLLFDTTVERNVAYGLRIRKIDKHIWQERVNACLQLVGLDGFQKRKARQLSGGETQRVAIARALAIHPDVLFLDEFSANIDQANRAILEKIIRTINQQLGTTIIFTTHYLDQAYRIADEVIHLFKGKVAQSPLKNLLHGTIRRVDDLWVFSTEHVSISVLAPHEGPAAIAIPSESIVLSKHPLESSMRNSLQGRITHIIDADNHVDLKVLAGESFEVTITKKSYHEMELHPGVSVYLSFKASAVEVF